MLFPGYHPLAAREARAAAKLKAVFVDPKIWSLPKLPENQRSDLGCWRRRLVEIERAYDRSELPDEPIASLQVSLLIAIRALHCLCSLAKGIQAP